MYHLLCARARERARTIFSALWVYFVFVCKIVLVVSLPLCLLEIAFFICSVLSCRGGAHIETWSICIYTHRSPVCVCVRFQDFNSEHVSTLLLCYIDDRIFTLYLHNFSLFHFVCLFFSFSLFFSVFFFFFAFDIFCAFNMIISVWANMDNSHNCCADGQSFSLVYNLRV